MNNTPTLKLVRHCRELGFTICADVYDYHVAYAIYDLLSTEGELLWPRRGSAFHPDPVTSLEESEPYCHGEVKWDGCSNWAFDEQDRCMLHGCSREDIQRFGDVLALCWDWTSEILPKWDEDLTWAANPGLGAASQIRERLGKAPLEVVVEQLSRKCDELEAALRKSEPVDARTADEKKLDQLETEHAEYKRACAAGLCASEDAVHARFKASIKELKYRMP